MKETIVWILVAIGALTVWLKMCWPVIWFIIEPLFSKVEKGAEPLIDIAAAHLTECLASFRRAWDCADCKVGMIVRIREGVLTTLIENEKVLAIEPKFPLYRHTLLFTHHEENNGKYTPAHYLVIFTSLDVIGSKIHHGDHMSKVMGGSFFQLCFAKWIVSQYTDAVFNADEYKYGKYGKYEGDDITYNYDGSAVNLRLSKMNTHEGTAADYEHVLEFLTFKSKPSNDNRVITNGISNKFNAAEI